MFARDALHDHGAILFASGGPGGGDQGRLQPRCTLTDARGSALAGTFVEAGAHAGPRDEMGRRGEWRHVGVDLGDQHTGRRVAQTGHRHQETDRGAKGTERVSHARVQVDRWQIEFLAGTARTYRSQGDERPARWGDAAAVLRKADVSSIAGPALNGGPRVRSPVAPPHCGVTDPHRSSSGKYLRTRSRSRCLPFHSLVAGLKRM